MRLSLLSEALEAPTDDDEFGASWYMAYIYLGNSCLVQINGELLEDPYNSANGVTLEAINEIGLDTRATGEFMIEIIKDNRLLLNVIASTIERLKKLTLKEIMDNYPEDWNDEAIDDRS